MKKISEHLGQIIVALAGVALLVAAVVVFKAPIGEFYNTMLDKETSITDTVLEGLDDINLSDIPVEGDVYEYGDYKYTYKEADGGWAVSINTDVTDKKQTSYGPILTEIEGTPVTSLKNTFMDCTNLTVAPAIPEGVTSMVNTFWKCTSLTAVPAIPSGVTNMGSTFAYCTSITDVSDLVIPSGVTSMKQTFAACTGLTDVSNLVIPASVTTLYGTFNGCTKLTTAPDMSQATSVTDMAATFQQCTKLTTAPVIPASVTNMQATFSRCYSLKTYAGSSAPDGDFSGYVIPSSVTTLYGTFQGCTSLRGTITVNANPTNYVQCFYGTTQPIALTGSSAVLAELAATATNGNVTVQ